MCPCCCFVLHAKLRKLQPFFRTWRERLTVNKLSFPNNWSFYGSRSSWRIVVIGSECLTKNTAVSQKCQQNRSTPRNLYRLPSAAITPYFDALSYFVWILAGATRKCLGQFGFYSSVRLSLMYYFKVPINTYLIYFTFIKYVAINKDSSQPLR